ncbi:hypothetical protein TYRP_007217 [Tyrophagus putrescentiae]|nr:hypothetical protein TYRP_007217 [Tyrophagus putrescentiae]
MGGEHQPQGAAPPELWSRNSGLAAKQTGLHPFTAQLCQRVSDCLHWHFTTTTATTTILCFLFIGSKSSSLSSSSARPLTPPLPSMSPWHS